MRRQYGFGTTRRTNLARPLSTGSAPTSLLNQAAKKKCGKSAMVENFIEMINTVKLYHWSTRSYSQHKATDELHANLNEHVDKFVEVLLGKKETRIKHLSATIPLGHKRTKHDFKERIYQYRDYLINMNRCFDETHDSDLLNIRDEILADINQFLYLLTFDK